MVEQNELVGYMVNRGIEGYAGAFGMTRDEFLHWLGGKKRVLDVGAGGGLLRKEIDILRSVGKFRSDVSVIPLDLAYSTEEGISGARYATHLAFTHVGVAPTKEFIGRVDAAFEADARSESFLSLPFKSGWFDAVLACYSYGIHSTSKEMLMRAFGETLRVLKRGGEALVSVSHDENAEYFSCGNKLSPVLYTTGDIAFLDADIKGFGESSFLEFRK